MGFDRGDEAARDAAASVGFIDDKPGKPRADIVGGVYFLADKEAGTDRFSILFGNQGCFEGAVAHQIAQTGGIVFDRSRGADKKCRMAQPRDGIDLVCPHR